MKDHNNKEVIIKDIRGSLMKKNNLTQPSESIEAPNIEINDPAVTFARQYTQRGGIMYFCASEQEITSQMKQLAITLGGGTWGCCSDNLTAFLTQMGIGNVATAQCSTDYEIGVLLCDALTANDGGVVLTEHQGLGSNFNALPKKTIVLAFTSQAVMSHEAAINRLQSVYPVFPSEVAILEPRNGWNQETEMHLVLIEDE